MKGKMSLNRNRDNDGTAREPLLGEESPMHFGNTWTSTPKYSKYSKLANQTDSPNRFDGYDGDIMSMQDKMLMNQNDQLQVISDSVGSLKTVSKQIGIELDEQAVMLDDLNSELENADSKLDSTIKKVAKVLHMNNDRRQWMAIGILVGLLMIILILFIIL
uniref:t-SNARE coiled-coil homology domain-containing protein n=2 Tax=Pectinophora gossypiella TaxID=13191 RepID=A0A1E1W691_PECGO